MSTIMGLEYLYLTTAETDSSGNITYTMDINPVAIKNALGLECTQIPADPSNSNDTTYPYKYLIHSADDNQNGVVLRMNSARASMDIKGYNNGVIDYSRSYYSAIGNSNNSQAVLYYKREEDYVIFGISQTGLEPRITIAYLDYQKLGESEKQKCFLLCSGGSSDAGRCILSDGNVYTFARKSSYTSDDIVTIAPLINITGRLIFPRAFLSNTNKSTRNTKYFVLDGKSYITLQHYTDAECNICIQI